MAGQRLFAGGVQSPNLEPDQREELERVWDEFYRLQRMIVTEDVEGQVINSSGGALSVGQIFGVAASGIVLAQSGGTRASGLVRNEVQSGEKFVPARFGLQYKVSLESALTIAVGEMAFLSDSSRGTATNVRPAGTIQFLGFFQTIRDDNDQAEIINMITGRDTGI